MNCSTPHGRRISCTRSMLAALGVAVIAMAAAPATAQKVDMRGASANTVGTVTLSIEDLGSITEGLMVSVDFDEVQRIVTAQDSVGNVFRGTYKRKGDGGRKLVIELDKQSKKDLKRTIKQIIKEETDSSKVKFGFDKLSVQMKVNKGLNNLKVKVKADVSGEADGERGRGSYKVKTSGPLAFPPPPL